ncbi:hypothetical protein TRFO_01492 [Tritrichomonas foetus]|uniref:Uncharacterized protein n=1 Tax=Tritrichomonas foetus TaxID=1144522 RepID=A0A1J4K246_9EUKA|nr:hypothetical protein TRFO_01492 [Tritrichomonas foetus]|eukprot:OHT03806.1 hypothetical protein TRFO_01492 [Tritrichomonas foetus]
MTQILQDVHLSIPLLIVPAADISPKCVSLMKFLCKGQLEINVKKNEKIINTANSFNVSPPQMVKTHPIFCNSFSELISYTEVLNEEKHHFFLKSYAILAFIDYSMNKNIEAITTSFSNFPGIQDDRKAFVIFDVPNDNTESFLSNQEDSAFHICTVSNQFSEIEGFFYIINFLSSVMAESASRLLNIGFKISDIQPKNIREEKVRADFASISRYEQEFMRQVKIGLNDIEGKYLPAFLASFYEILASYEELKPGIINEYKISNPSSHKSPFKYTPSSLVDSGSSPIVQFYLASAYQYHEHRYYDKCIDIGIKLINSGYKALIHPLVLYISKRAEKKFVLNRAWDLLSVIQRQGLQRRSAVVANQFSKIYKRDASKMFIIYALDLILKNTNKDSLVQIRDLGFPMVIELLESKQNVSKTILSRFISSILCSIGQSLDFQHQELLLHELKNKGCEEVNLPLCVEKVIFEKPQVIISRNISKGSNNDNNGLFLYSYLPQKNKEEKSITAAVNSVVTIHYVIKNPLSVILQLDDVRTVCQDCDCKLSSHFLAPNKTTIVHSSIVPLKSGTIPINGLEFNFFGAHQKIDIVSDIIIQAVDNVPHFTLRTDLPITSRMELYEGEERPFTLWVTNSGTEIINSLDIEYLQPEIVTTLSKPKLPLLPGQKTAIHCCLTASKDEEYISLTVRSNVLPETTTESSNASDPSDKVDDTQYETYNCSQTLRQYYDTIESLKINRVFLMERPPQTSTDEEFASLSDFINVGYEVLNNTDCAFQYDAVISNKSISGIIGAHESVLTIAAYKTSELKSDGSDAQRSRVIALTKIKEESLGRSLSQPERVIVAKEVGIMQRLEAKWHFTWRVSSARHGILSSKATSIDKKLFSGIERRQIRPNIKWVLESSNEEVENVMRYKVHRLDVDFGEDQITDCSLILMSGNPAKSGILWQKNLAQHDDDGKTNFDFILSFSTCEKFKMIIKFVSSQGVSGEKPIIVNVVE